MCGRINTIDGKRIGPGDSTHVITRSSMKELRFGKHNGSFDQYNQRLETVLKKHKDKATNKVLLPFETFEEKGNTLYPRYNNIYLAGLEWDESFMILTMKPGKDFREKVHHRMPVIVTKDWLFDTRITPYDHVPEKSLSLEPVEELEAA